MTPAAHWSPDDYFRASRRARKLGEGRLAQQQIQEVIGGLDDGRATRAVPEASGRDGCGPLIVEPARGHSPSLARGDGGGLVSLNARKEL